MSSRFFIVVGLIVGASVLPRAQDKAAGHKTAGISTRKRTRGLHAGWVRPTPQ